MTPEPRHSPSKNTIGQLHLSETLPLIIGLYHFPAVLIPWILLSPIPAALTREGGNHAARLLILFPALAWVITLGVRRLQKSILYYLFSIFWLSSVPALTSSVITLPITASSPLNPINGALAKWPSSPIPKPANMIGSF